MNETVIAVATLVFSCFGCMFACAVLVWGIRVQREVDDGHQRWLTRQEEIRRMAGRQLAADEGVIIVYPGEICPLPGCHLNLQGEHVHQVNKPKDAQ